MKLDNVVLKLTDIEYQNKCVCVCVCEKFNNVIRECGEFL